MPTSAVSRADLAAFSGEAAAFAVLEGPSEVLASFVLVLGSTWLAAKFENENLRDAAELLRAFFLTSVPWLCLRDLRRVWADDDDTTGGVGGVAAVVGVDRAGGDACVAADGAAAGGDALAGRVRPCR